MMENVVTPMHSRTEAIGSGSSYNDIAMEIMGRYTSSISSLFVSVAVVLPVGGSLRCRSHQIIKH